MLHEMRGLLDDGNAELQGLIDQSAAIVQEQRASYDGLVSS